MADQKKPTHLAVHQVVMNDAEGNRVEVAPGTPFAPNKADVAHLEAAGAIKKFVEEPAQVEDDGGAAIAHTQVKTK